MRIDSASTSLEPDAVITGRSARMRAIFDFVRVVADGDSSVLIVGETGTGKETIARLIHQASPRRRKPFVAVSCATFSETLIESELFGHERGAFTGAVTDRPGRFELANGGTIFLDDIDDVPLSMQVKLLRVLQNRTIERLGGTRTIPVDVRVITAAKRDLKELAADGKFREDLYYRLNVVPIVLPPLRDRREDLPALMDHFMRRYFRRRGEDPRPISPTVRQAFLRHNWPGNVRELENACERMAQTCVCDQVRVGCAPAAILFADHPEGALESPPETMVTSPEPDVTTAASLSLDDRLREVESSIIQWGLRMAAGNQSKAADLLGIKRSTLGDRIRKLGLDKAHVESN
jgi:two-component system, NtrC family, response regulator AtoC